jgi:hypothetical protein
MKKLGKIKDLLSREEMKQIQGGSGSGGGCMTKCTKASDCTYYNCKVCHSFATQGSFCMTN